MASVLIVHGYSANPRIHQVPNEHILCILVNIVLYSTEKNDYQSHFKTCISRPSNG